MWCMCSGSLLSPMSNPAKVEEFDFADEEQAAHSSDYRCCVCLVPAFEPVEHAECGQLFCAGCVGSLDRCPTCRGALVIKPVTLKLVLSRLGELTVVCKRCKLTCLRDAFSTHACMGLCTQGCGASVAGRDMAQHVATECPSAPVECRAHAAMCPWTGTRQLLAAHEATCHYVAMAPLVQTLLGEIGALREQVAQLRARQLRCVGAPIRSATLDADNEIALPRLAENEFGTSELVVRTVLDDDAAPALETLYTHKSGAVTSRPASCLPATTALYVVTSYTVHMTLHRFFLDVETGDGAQQTVAFDISKLRSGGVVVVQLERWTDKFRSGWRFALPRLVISVPRRIGTHVGGFLLHDSLVVSRNLFALFDDIKSVMSGKANNSFRKTVVEAPKAKCCTE
jgi:hypothetical protein